jgi:tryptophan-rich sensory protein
MSLPLFLVYFAACAVAGATGAIFRPGEWYDSLRKPDWTPPNWLFPVAWSTLYVLMSLSAARIAGMTASNELANFAIGLWALQIAVNMLWTPIFFGLRRLGDGMIVLALLWLVVAATCVAFWRIDWVSGLMFAPYVVWVTVAGALNFSVWRLNRGAVPA